jgi:tetratricopeptide (TPR) repeat protein
MTRLTVTWGLAWETIGRTDEALEQFSEAVRMNEKYAQAQYNLGLAQFGRQDEARTHLTEALRLQPDYPEAKQHLLELGAPRPH